MIGKLNKRNVLLTTHLALASLLIAPTGLAPAYAVDNSPLIVAESGGSGVVGDDWKYKGRNKCKAPAQNKKSSETENESSGQDDSAPSGGYVAEPWFVEGTPEYEVAQKTFKAWTEEMGASGAFAAGVLANIKHESRFVPDIAEYYDVKNPDQVPMTKSINKNAVEAAEGHRMGMNNKNPVLGMAYYANHSSGPMNGGAGLYAFTPFDKFTDSSSWKKINTEEGWGVENQTHYVIQEGFVGINGWVPINTGVALVGLSSQEELISTNNPRDAALAFQAGYERPRYNDPARGDSAIRFNEIFNKDNIKADLEKWRSVTKPDKPHADLDTSSPSEADPSTGSGSNSKDECGSSYSMDKSTSNGWAQAEDGTGAHNIDLGTHWTGKAWKDGDLPEELKQYAIDPRELGIKYAECDAKWVDYTGGSYMDQCVALSKIMFGSYWQKDGKSPARFTCDGIVCAKEAAAANGGKVSKKPTRGAIGSDTNSSLFPHPWGHTYVVSHVFENGDMLVIEQNFTGYSGQLAPGETCNWNWRLIPESSIEYAQMEFYAPLDEGFEPVNPNDNKSTLEKVNK